MRARSLVATLAVLALAPAAPAFAAFTPQQREQLEAAVQSTMKAGSYPGIAAGVWAPGGDVFVHAFGVREVTAAGGPPLKVGDRFRVGSITKTMTATVILRLVQAGRISLDEPLSVFYPGILNAGQITIRELLNHTSLIQTLDQATGESLLRVPSQRFDPAEVIGAALTQPFCAPPWCYSDTNYLLLGQIIRKVTHRSLADALRRYVFRPLRLRHTGFHPGTRFPGPRANGYNRENGQLVDVTRWTTSYSWAAGSATSTLADLHRWSLALVRGTLLSPRLQAERLQWVSTGTPGFEYGLGIFKIAGYLGHNGLIPGYDSAMLYEPLHRITVVVLGNADPQFYEPKLKPTPITLKLAFELGQIAAGAPPTGAPGAAVH